jgi:hypothetical protein
LALLDEEVAVRQARLRGGGGGGRLPLHEEGRGGLPLLTPHAQRTARSCTPLVGNRAGRPPLPLRQPPPSDLALLSPSHSLLGSSGGALPHSQQRHRTPSGSGGGDDAGGARSPPSPHAPRHRSLSVATGASSWAGASECASFATGAAPPTAVSRPPLMYPRRPRFSRRHAALAPSAAAPAAWPGAAAPAGEGVWVRPGAAQALFGL